MNDYNHKDIEAKWQQTWKDQDIYKTDESSDKPKCYILDMFPYPSGAGLHVGHPRGFIATDVYARRKRMTGHNVLHPMGWDAFGLPAENHAIANKTHPSIQVEKNIDHFKDQLYMLGPDYDWSREINTTDPAYYKWTQWCFLKMMEKGLAYESYEPINWCPGCKTGLANEDLDADGTCERCSSVVEKKPMRQWVLRITDYADRLIDDLDTLPQWPEWVKEAQRNWISRSYGSKIPFTVKVKNSDTEEVIEIFTTRADTLFGCTYFVLAPEHSFIAQHASEIINIDEVKKYQESLKSLSMIDRMAHGKEKTGICLEGIIAINPANGEEIPVWIADYVLADYGTGAVMAVPAHDERDFAFAKKYHLPIQDVVAFNYEADGLDKAKEDVETLHREVVDAIIENNKGEFLLMKEETNGIVKIHFVGGGTEGEDEIDALKKEISEETGYINIASINKIPGQIHCYAYRHTKSKNQKTHGYCFHVKLKDNEKIKSEVDEGKHSLLWAKKDEVKNLINWPHHLHMWEMFLNGGPFIDSGILINSESFDGLSSEEAKQKITEHVGGKMVSSYKLRDWVFSRQRYWGEPIPVIHCEHCGVVPVPYDQLPVALPDVESYEPTGTGESPLAAIDAWVNVTCPTCGGAGKRETNTMPQWAGSSWYYLRYIDPKNTEALIDGDKEKYWNPVDVYVGGDHATRHLIYARFWHKFLYDIGVVTHIEPFPRLEFLGHILGEDGTKISKRKGNGAAPEDVVEKVGADTLRTYEMFIGPFEKAVPWSTDGLVGVRRFLEKVWRIAGTIESGKESSLEVQKMLHKTVKKVSEDIEQFKFNTAVSQMMILANTIEKEGGIGRDDFASYIKILAPFAPHITDELWHNVLDNTTSVHLELWPDYNEEMVKDDVITLGVQINGKVRGEITLAPDADEETVKKMITENSEYDKWLVGGIQKFIYIPGKIISIVVSQ